MELIKKHMEQIELFDVYSKMLTVKQRKVFEDYYIYNISLTEIAENCSISKQAVMDLLKRTQKLLKVYEANLGICAKLKEIKNLKLDDKDKQMIIDILKR